MESSKQRYPCTAGSATGVFNAGGELLAVPFAVPKSGYKAKGAYGYRPVFDGESTNSYYQKQVLAAGEGRAKKLEPYRPNAPRNRPKYLLENVVGNRHKLHPCIQHETYCGSSKVQLADGSVKAQNPWKTTNQAFAECTQAREVTGMGNPGISSDIARYFHRKQDIYGTK